LLELLLEGSISRSFGYLLKVFRARRLTFDEGRRSHHGSARSQLVMLRCHLVPTQPTAAIACPATAWPSFPHASALPTFLGPLSPCDGVALTPSAPPPGRRRAPNHQSIKMLAFQAFHFAAYHFAHGTFQPTATGSALGCSELDSLLGGGQAPVDLNAALDVCFDPQFACSHAKVQRLRRRRLTPTLTPTQRPHNPSSCLYPNPNPNRLTLALSLPLPLPLTLTL
jgi:hypothetical protein